MPELTMASVKICQPGSARTKIIGRYLLCKIRHPTIQHVVKGGVGKANI
jgi:hypothetical protein